MRLILKYILAIALFTFATREHLFYSQRTACINEGITGAGRTSQDDSVFGVTNLGNGNDVSNTATSAPSEGLYGAGRFGYTMNDVTSSVNVLAAASTTTVATGSWSTSNAFADNVVLDQAGYNIFTNFNADASASAVGNIHDIVAVGKSVIPNFDANGARAFNVAGTDKKQFIQSLLEYLVMVTMYTS